MKAGGDGVASGPCEQLAPFGRREKPLALEPVLLGAGNAVWLVEQGGIDLFHVAIVDGAPSGARRHVCRIGPGALVIDRPGLPDSALVAVALSDTVWLRLDDGGAGLAPDSPAELALRALMDDWRCQLQRAVPGLGAEAADPRASHCALLSLLETRALEARAAERAQMQAGALCELQQMQQALSEVSAVLATSEEAASTAASDPLLAACRLVLRASGVTVGGPQATVAQAHAPGRWLEDFCRANHLIQRRVRLNEPSWWRQDRGALLAYRGADQCPVALLPDARGYLLVDPATGARCRVDQRAADSLGQQATAFLPSLPATALRFRDLLRFSLIGSRQDRWRLILFGMAGGLLGMTSPMVMHVLIDSVLPAADRGELAQIILLLAISAVCLAAFTFCRTVAAMRIRTRLGNGMQCAVIDRLLALPATFFRDHEAGDLAQRAMGIDAALQVFSETAESAVFGWFFGLFSLLYLLFLDLRLAMLAVVLVGLQMSWTLALNYQALLVSRMSASLSGQIASRVFQLLTGVAKLRSHGAEARAFSIWARLFARQKTLDMRVKRIGATLGTINAGYGLVCSILLFGSVAFLMPDMRAGQFLAFSAAFAQFLGATMALGSALTSSLGIIPLYERARPILEALPEYGGAVHAPGALSGAIDISGVSFGYGKDGPEVLRDVSLSIRPGEFVALVGPSGCGKSTLLRLLLGFETPRSGAVYYDGQDLSGLDKVAVRRQIGTVLQNGRLIAGDLYTNIVGAAMLTLDDAMDAARLAGLEEDVRAMPMGLHTMISDGASTISGGQRQRLMIARAIVNKPPILLFDEATSALDNRTQSIVAGSIARLKATRVVIAHRLSTIAGADRIFFLEQGRIVESGTYEELMALNGRFKSLAGRQLV